MPYRNGGRFAEHDPDDHRPAAGALHRQVIQNLSGIGDVNLPTWPGTSPRPHALARRYIEDLRFLEDLSWRPAEDLGTPST